MPSCPHSFPDLTATHGFFGRIGGVSSGVYDSLNISYSSQDDPGSVDKNRAVCCEALFSAADYPLLTCQQVHGTAVHTVTSAAAWHSATGAPAGDALVTRTPGIALGIQTADCAPVLFHDSTNGVIGAAHAGWKGALGGVMEQTVQAMLRLGAATDAIVAAIGPCIRQSSYEVDSVFYQTFVADVAANQTFFKAADTAGKYLFDLPAFLHFRLYACGVTSVLDCELDTVADETRFFSFRRATLRGEGDYGRQLSVISL